MASRWALKPLRISALHARHYTSSPSTLFENILVSTPKPGVGLVTLNRVRAHNALSTALFTELNTALEAFDADDAIGATVLTGSPRAFAAGADIKEMSTMTFSSVFSSDFLEPWAKPTRLTKPLLAAVNGVALGGGCELAMMADLIYASAGARFGQPEIKLGVIPGAGGSQRLARAVGKAKAMELILTGREFSAAEAERWGVVARVFDSPEECVEGALQAAETIASYSRLAVKAAKEVVNKSQELGIRDGVEYERRVFHGLFGSQDQKIGTSPTFTTELTSIGMKAFLEKQSPKWKNE